MSSRDVTVSRDITRSPKWLNSVTWSHCITRRLDVTWHRDVTRQHNVMATWLPSITSRCVCYTMTLRDITTSRILRVSSDVMRHSDVQWGPWRCRFTWPDVTDILRSHGVMMLRDIMTSSDVMDVWLVTWERHVSKWYLWLIKSMQRRKQLYLSKQCARQPFLNLTLFLVLGIA